MFTKADQLKKSKKSNDKKLSERELLFFKHTISTIATGKCQLCRVRPIADYHHAVYGSFGADKDDRSLMGICNECHYAIHHGKDGDSQKLRQEAITIGVKNWERHNG